MPVAQFNPFERLDVAAMRSGGEENAREVWDRLSDERDRYLDGLEDDLTKSA
jgi:hypothetical protein